MKTALIVIFTSSAALSVGIGATSMLMLRAGVLQRPETVVVTRWAIPPQAPVPVVLPTPLTAAEQLRLQEAIKCPYIPSTSTSTTTSTTTPTSTPP